MDLNFKILKREIVQQNTFIGKLNSMVRQLRDPEQETAESPVAEGKENIYSFELFVKNTNLIFLIKLASAKIKLSPVRIELRTDHHWFRCLVLIHLC